MVRELVKSNTTVWDIGANMGLFSFAAAALGAEVLALEAGPRLAALLRRSAQLNGLPVTVVPATVNDTFEISDCTFPIMVDRPTPCWAVVTRIPS
jgi:FkbM family methyltransferase